MVFLSAICSASSSSSFSPKMPVIRRPSIEMSKESTGRRVAAKAREVSGTAANSDGLKRRRSHTGSSTSKLWSRMWEVTGRGLTLPESTTPASPLETQRSLQVTWSSWGERVWSTRRSSMRGLFVPMSIEVSAMLLIDPSTPSRRIDCTRFSWILACTWFAIVVHALLSTVLRKVESPGSPRREASALATEARGEGAESLRAGSSGEEEEEKAGEDGPSSRELSTCRTLLVSSYSDMKCRYRISSMTSQNVRPAPNSCLSIGNSATTLRIGAGIARMAWSTTWIAGPRMMPGTGRSLMMKGRMARVSALRLTLCTVLPARLQARSSKGVPFSRLNARSNRPENPSLSPARLLMASTSRQCPVAHLTWSSCSSASRSSALRRFDLSDAVCSSSLAMIQSFTIFGRPRLPLES
mmetsp:Transcript_58543/g.137851  ORF Transcript_58543/g.137851 Transcript_58543/m.137851 type:complete len:411 (-) Transcript_58543:292-1524(-)